MRKVEMQDDLLNLTPGATPNPIRVPVYPGGEQMLPERFCQTCHELLQTCAEIRGAEDVTVEYVCSNARCPMFLEAQ